jgi:hypothetical protein
MCAFPLVMVERRLPEKLELDAAAHVELED